MEDSEKIILTHPAKSIIMSLNSMSIHSIKRDSGGRGPREERKEATRRRILEAAFAVYSRRGSLGASTVEVAEEAGVAHGSVFVHFGTQAGLIAAVIEAFGEEVMAAVHGTMGEGTTIRDALEAHLAAIRDREAFYAALVVEAPRLAEPARAALTLIQSAIAFHLTPALRGGIAAGRVVDLPLPLLFNTWIGLLHHYVTNRDLFAPGESVVERRGQELLDFYIALISGPKTNQV